MTEFNVEAARIVRAAPGPDGVTPDALPASVTDLLAAIAEALTLPLPSTDLADERAFHALLVRRATHVRILLASIVDYPDVAIDRDAADVRTHVEQNPITYTTYDTEKAEAEARGDRP